MMDRIIKEEDAVKEMEKAGVCEAGVTCMKEKAKFRLVKLEEIESPMANIIKEIMLMHGGECANHMQAISCKVEKTDCLLMGTMYQYKILIEKLPRQPFGGKEIAERMKKVLGL